MAFEPQFMAVISNANFSVSFWIYFVDWILSLVLGLAFIFYFHKLLGFLVTLVCKLILWNVYRIRVHIDAFKLSPLGGRLFMKNLTIVTADTTISILNVTFTWRYWIVSLTKLSGFYWDTDSETGGVSQRQNDKSPCRFIVDVEGIEIFTYNKTAAYDNIMDILNGKKLDEKSGQRKDQEGKTANGDNEQEKESSTSSAEYDVHGHSDEKDSNQVQNEPSEDSNIHSKQTVPLLLQILPIDFRIKKGAFVVGNVTTPSVLVASFKYGRGLLDITKAPNPVDHYRLLHDFRFDEFQIWIRPNIGFDKYRYGKEDHEKIHSDSGRMDNLRNIKSYKLWYKFLVGSKWIGRKVQEKVLRKHKPNDDSPDDQLDWKGLRRYIGDSEDPVITTLLTSDEQYAKYSLILDSTSTRFVYFYDSPGIQPSSTSCIEREAPESGLEIEISFGTIHYGPWADRQRIPLQNMLFPSLARDSVPTSDFLKAGLKRDYEGFKVTVIVRDELVLRIPTREASKDKEFLKQNPNHQAFQKTARPFGWLELKVAEGSNVGSFTSFISNQEKGFPNKLKVNLSSPEIRSSVNHDVLYSADSHEINADIALPSQWNGKCNWSFDQVSLNPRLFLLREHLFLLSDLFTDFASGEPQPYENFRPFLYKINWKLINYELYLNVNDSNIINNPLDFNSNKYLSFQGEELNINLSIPLNGASTKKTTISYFLDTSHFDLILDTPPWHTVNTFLKGSNVVGKSGQFSVQGDYTFYSAVEVNTSNCIEINCFGEDICLKFFGFVIRYLFTVKDNYFGEHVHFKTFEEYNYGSVSSESSKDVQSQTESTVDDKDLWKMFKTENDVDVLFKFQVRNGLMLLPRNLYSCSSHIGLHFDTLDVDMRFCNYYMDMQVDFSPISGVLNSADVEPSDLMDVACYVDKYLQNNVDMQVDGFTVHSHRMFSAPPEEVTFWCKWDFCFGDWVIDSSPYFLQYMISGLSNFSVGFKDQANALEELFPPAFDAANFSIRFSKFILRLRPDAFSFVEVILDDILLSVNDVPNMRYSSKLVVSIPGISSKIVEVDDRKSEKIMAALNTSIVFTNICQKVDMIGLRDTREFHVRDGDAPFHRAPFLLFENFRDSFYRRNKGCLLTTMSLPKVHVPLTEATSDRWMPKGSSSSTSSDTSSLTSSKSSDLEFPTVNYCDGDFCPSYSVDPDTEYDNLILEIGDVKSFLSPASLPIIYKVAQTLEDFDLESVMDQVGSTTIKGLQSLMSSSKEIKNLRLVNHNLVLYLGQYHLENVDNLEAFYHDKDRIVLRTSNISLALSSKTQLTTKSGQIDLEESITIAYHMSFLSLSCQQKNKHQLAFVINIQDIEGWLNKIKESAEGSTRYDYLDGDFDVNQAQWLAGFLKQFSKSLEQEMTMFENLQSKRETHANLVHALTVASSEYAIDHDPDVLTRPAYFLRLKSEHIRFFDGWKVTARLQHILRTLPKSWIDDTSAKFKARAYKLPDNAFEQVLDIFSGWRAWEANQQQRLYMFKTIFGKEISGVTKKSTKFDFIGISTTLKSSDSKDTTFINLEELDLSYKSTFSDSKGELSDIAEMVVKLNNYESKVTKEIFEYVRKVHLCDVNQDLESVVKDEATNESHAQVSDTPPVEATTLPNRKKSLNIIVDVKAFEQTVSLFNTSVGIRLESFLSHIDSNNVSKGQVYAIGANEVELRSAVDSRNVLIQDFSGMHVLFAQSDSALHVDVEVDTSSTFFFDKNDNFVSTLRTVLERDYPYVTNLMKSIPQGSNVKSTQPKLSKSLSASMKMNEVIWNFGVLHPLVFSGAILNTSLSASMVDDVLTSKLKVEKIKSNLGMALNSILELHSADLMASISFYKSEKVSTLTSNVYLGYFKALLPDLNRAMIFATKDKFLLEEKVNAISEVLKKVAPIDKSTPNKFKEIPCLFKLRFKNDYFEVASIVHRASVSLGLEGSTLNLSNVSTTELPEGKFTNYRVQLYGDISLPAIRLSLMEKGIPIGLSNILAFGVSVRLFNDIDTPGKRQNLQVESQYFRVCLSEPVVVSAITLIDEVMKHFSGSKESQQVLQDAFQTPEAQRNTFESWVYTKFSSFQFLFYDFCVGWLFNDESKENPGIIVGAEKFFAATEENLGKFTLMGSYFSIANGNQSSNFYSTESEQVRLNRGFLPMLQLIFMIEKQSKTSKHLRITLRGDEVDVKFLSTSVGSTIQKSTTQALRIQKYLEQKAAARPLEEEKTNTEKTTKQPTVNTSFQSIEFSSTFAGSNVSIYRLEDDEQENTPSLYLHAPAFNTAFRFKKMTDSKSQIMGELVISQSENVLFPKCVPVFLDLAASTKDLMRSPKPEKGKPEDNSNNTNFIESLLQEMDIHFGLRIEKQFLTLSCEPTAKVAAVVGLEGIHVQLNTDEGTNPSFTASLLLDWVSASLQHIYSREISASMKVEKILLSSNFEIGAKNQNVTSGCMTEVDGFINVKQYQDVDLFKDIWFPRELFEIYATEDGTETGHEKQDQVSELAQDKSISSKFKEVSTTYAFPWIVLFVANAINLQVDFGQSLGVSNLTIENFWAVSKKSLDWSQDLKAGINAIKLSSKGRLGGFLTVSDINLHTAISWKLKDGDTLDVPLILLSGGVNKLAAKVSFDYNVVAIANVECFSMDIYNRKGTVSMAKDHLFVTTKFNVAELYMTSLTASNFVDISNTISRMIQDNRRSYKETLRDSSRGDSVDKKTSSRSYSNEAILKTIKKLQTKIHVSAGKILVHIYPSSIDNSKVLVINLDESRIKFQQNEYGRGMANEMDVKFNDLKVSLSTVPSVDEVFVEKCSVDEFVEMAHKAKGGSIFVFPSFRISMRTFQKDGTNVIEYYYQSTFSGTVDIRWNLGSVNFIREMYSIHANALASRMEYRHRMRTLDDIENSKSILKQQLNAEDPTKDIDDAIQERLEKAETMSKFRYVALAPPIIEAPQLKELGNATPPLEWFGLHRDKFPNFTHELVIVNLQKLVHEIELRYSKTLGKA
ncbi:Csf1 protein [Candida orthopsilosis Co 90-125]|uniref:Csf1 protein n=1 Tax=Candida orthopsilosis (strain 90-125) TaxID=1136231 RepID=H8X8B8_CANO9|nr:Csf1 protein [Candida orthopsilosis Co 90-125]CCG24217.1 Csf1 protein [Candida orthopsilosis Co 90-125]